MTSLLQSFITEEMVLAAIKGVIDPELGINIVDLGLIYSVEIREDGRIHITITLTTPGCPLHASFAQEIERVLWQAIPDLTGVAVELVWKPAWSPIMISPEGRALLGID
ncbi:MAG: metal-sulfur cluster assembly factor [Ardenticatenaceae bacterium]|nr:metal-sulfur cluster assembly factor [Anaerolineales bacterium]MCB8940511.1 metal-sulfur cluster assembly factor [Ardenticatenaceae bacterium]MCB8973532.1 metal-sulfur cluster assembly factor [Ardenticatenaceae bacterium]